MIALALLLAAQTATSSCSAPVDARPADVVALWCVARADATRWERLAARRAADLRTCREGSADRDELRAEGHARLVEAPPPAPEASGLPGWAVAAIAGGAGVLGVVLGVYVGAAVF